MQIEMDISIPSRYKGTDQEWYSSALVRNSMDIQYYQTQLESFLKLENPDQDDITFIKNMIEMLFIERSVYSEKYVEAVKRGK